MGGLIFILGGARSGKSTYAEQLAQDLGGSHVLFVATAEIGDEEMAQRITRHRQARPQAWRTVEAPRQVGATIRADPGNPEVVLIDCLTLLVSNIMLALGDVPDPQAAERAVQEEISTLLQTCQGHPATFIVVSNEVGLGLVPDNPLGRLYRDLLGRANQTIAAQAREVYFMVAGLAVELKALAGRRPPASR